MSAPAAGRDAGTPTAGAVLVHREGGALHVVLSNPGRRNALTWEMYDRLVGVCDDVAADPSVRVVVLRGAGGAFAAGTDIRQFAGFDGADGLAYERRVGSVLERLAGVRVPVVGVVEGPAVGAGLALAALCDVLVATPGARFGVPVARTLGNCIPAAVVARLQRRLGTGRTTAMLLTARLLDAREAATAGFVHLLVEEDGLEEAVAGLLGRVLAGAPLTLAALKEVDRRLAAAAAAVEDSDLLLRCYGSADFREGVTAFLEHRAPRWEGR
ncbi:enoyl-CoA hydratase [Kineococcus sp. NUM-3379]